MCFSISQRTRTSIETESFLRRSYFKDEEDKRKYLRDNEIRERKEFAKDNNQIEILK